MLRSDAAALDGAKSEAVEHPGGGSPLGVLDGVPGCATGRPFPIAPVDDPLADLDGGCAADLHDRVLAPKKTPRPGTGNSSPTAVPEREAAHGKNLHVAGKGARCIQSECDRFRGRIEEGGTTRPARADANWRGSGSRPTDRSTSRSAIRNRAGHRWHRECARHNRGRRACSPGAAK